MLTIPRDGKYEQYGKFQYARFKFTQAIWKLLDFSIIAINRNRICRSNNYKFLPIQVFTKVCVNFITG